MPHQTLKRYPVGNKGENGIRRGCDGMVVSDRGRRCPRTDIRG